MLNGSFDPGPNGIYPFVLNICSEAVAWPLYVIFCKSLESQH